ncbi:peptidase S24/S26A/S26B/S26C [Chaetomidium leptoderma]|uniref:Peptidase S24/S26A/S26B/S26C n=1 Tax=Chaetomidium leptoderma TaxID=669021 RepID=A0AAN7A0N6_9PEZI|nr:peptidase S24/S26A/S26B/S26C [Chaetomidium leptoderma]
MPSITPILRSLLRPTRSRLTSKSNHPLPPQPQPQPPPQNGQTPPPPPPPPPSWIGHPLRVVFNTLKFVAFTHLIWEYVISMAPASGPSMLPTFEVVGEWLLVSRLHRRGRGIAVGDVVTYNIPVNDDVGVKRVLGLPGDYVLMDTPPSADGGAAAGGGSMIQVPQGHCWIVGDNLVASRDSRYFGPVPLALVRGKVIATMRPFSDFRWIANTMQKADGPTEG